MIILSVEEARKQLGEDGQNMSDEEVILLVNQLDELAKFLLDMYTKANSRTKKDN